LNWSEDALSEILLGKLLGRFLWVGFSRRDANESTSRWGRVGLVATLNAHQRSTGCLCLARAWRRQFEERPNTAFSGEGRRRREESPVAELERKIGQ